MPQTLSYGGNDDIYYRYLLIFISKFGSSAFESSVVFLAGKPPDDFHTQKYLFLCRFKLSAYLCVVDLVYLLVRYHKL